MSEPVHGTQKAATADRGFVILAKTESIEKGRFAAALAKKLFHNRGWRALGLA